MKDQNRAPSLALPLAFAVLSAALFFIVCIFAFAFMDTRLDSASGEAGSSASFALAALILLPIGMIALAVETLVSALAFSFSLRFAIRRAEKRAFGIVLTVLTGLFLVGGIVLFFGGLYFPLGDTAALVL